MIGNVCLGFNDYAASKAFYDAILPNIGMPLQRNHEGRAFCYGPNAEGPGLLWILRPQNRQEATFGNGTSISLFAKTRAMVDEFYKNALANGGTDEGAPGIRERYHPNFYGAYVRDPVGNKLLCVCHTPE